jgi:hypothetical protein
VPSSKRDICIVVVIDQSQYKLGLLQAFPHASALRPIDQRLALLIVIPEFNQLSCRNVQ